MAISILNEFDTSADNKKNMYLLTVEHSYFKNNVLELARFADCKNFIAHPMVQNILTIIWSGQSSQVDSVIENHWVLKFKVIFF